MSRNKIFCDVILDGLANKRRLRLQEIYPLVKARVPEWCINDWQKGVQGSLKFLKDKKIIAGAPIPENSRVYTYRLLM